MLLKDKEGKGHWIDAVTVTGDGQTVLYDSVLVDVCHYALFKPLEHTVQRLNPNVTYGLLLFIYQC